MNRIALVAVMAALGCGRGKSEVRAPEVTVPERPVTAGDRILALAPGGADAVLEVDLARLRDNAAVGGLVRAITASELAVPDLIAAADLLVFCSYRVGEADAGQVVFAAGGEVERLPGARLLDKGLVAIGPPALLDRVDLVRAGAQPSLAADRALLRVRALAMPERATGAALRMAARLGFEGRLSLARRLELEAVPAWLSVWVDVADDLAAVALLGGDGAGEAQDLAAAVVRVRKRLARSAPTTRLGLRPTVAATKIEVTGNDVRVVLVVGPRRLGQLVEHVMARLAAPAAAREGGGS
ncbi:MAG TPA: hypothetical protein VK698_18760 [Kofleriaceae bacterium]|nr:hypothetical protein [Kofleriaceae bacterium]